MHFCFKYKKKLVLTYIKAKVLKKIKLQAYYI